MELITKASRMTLLSKSALLKPSAEMNIRTSNYPLERILKAVCHQCR